VAELIFIEQKPQQGREHVPREGATIGREGCDIELADPEASRRHAAIRRAGEALLIEDLGSTNGTFVNGERIGAPRRLSEGDEVRIGETVWLVQPPGGATRVAKAVAEPQVTAARPVQDVAKQAPTPAGAPERRGDVPRPDFAPSAIRRVIPPPGAVAGFQPTSTPRRRGSAATRVGATVGAMLVIALTAGGVVLYYMIEPFK
jgi:predicted component of type VI protein secretion system